MAKQKQKLKSKRWRRFVGIGLEGITLGPKKKEKEPPKKK